ncbi:bifunctional DedA family/phosphatase PAP2 family protein [Endothiovibrio diazotrophicus]
MEWFDPQPVLDWFTAHPGWGGLGVLLIAFGESLALVGLIVPGTVLMFGVGALVALGALPLWPTLLYAFLGAAAGDAASFWLGRRYGERLRGVWPFNRHPELIEGGIAFFRRHGGKSVLFGRFFGPLRPVIPAVAGMLHMHPGRFLAFNLLSAAGWAPAYLLPGIALGASLSLAAEVAGRLALLLLLLLVALGAIWWLVHRGFNRLYPRAERLVARGLAWAGRHPLFGRTVAALVDPEHPEPLGLLFVAALLVGGAWGFVHLAGAVAAGPLGWDEALFDALQGLRTPAADRLMVAFTQLTDGVALTLFAALVAGWLAWRRQWPLFAHWLAALAFALAAPSLLKPLLAIPRPELIAGLEAYAFPSGHANRAAALYGFLAVAVARGLRLPWRWLPYSVATVVAVAVAFSRVYLGAHWPSDVLGGLALGLAWAALLGIAYSRHAPPAPARLTAVALVALLAVQLPWHLWRGAEDLQRYALRQTTEVMGVRQWWTGGWATLPQQREDLVGRHRQPLSLQWFGELPVIRAALAAAGWREPPPFDGATALRWLAPGLPLAELPLLPRVHDGRHEALAMIRPAAEPERQWVLRLWRAPVTSGEGRPLWLGSLQPQALYAPFPWFHYPRTGPFEADAVERLRSALADWRTAYRGDGVLLIVKELP